MTMVRSVEKVAIVTGAASGMGEAIATSLIASNWKVALVDISRDAGSAVAASLGPNAKFFFANVADYSSQATMFQSVWDTWGRIDALCANAGIVDQSSIFILGWREKAEIPPAPDLSCTDIDYKGVVYGTQLAIHFMRKNEVPGGTIVCTASIAAIIPHKSYPEYNGAKAAVVNFVRSTAPVLKIKDNITINAVCPGIVATKIIPPEMVAAVSPECMTPVSTIVKAYHLFLEDNSLNGQIIEASVSELFFLNEPKGANGRFTKRSVTVWDPLFKMIHGENSELPEALP